MQNEGLRSEIDAIRSENESGKFGFFQENAYQRARKRTGEQPTN